MLYAFEKLVYTDVKVWSTPLKYDPINSWVAAKIILIFKFVPADNAP